MAQLENVTINYKVKGTKEVKEELHEILKLEKQSISLTIHKDLRLWVFVGVFVNALISAMMFAYLIHISN
jgi:hypothetical protein